MFLFGPDLYPALHNKNSSNDVLVDPPENYMPEGWIFFITRGPLADQKNRISILGLNDYLDGKGGSRKDQRKEDAAEKATKRDYELGAGREARGLALGVDSQKDVALVAQQQAKLSNARYEGELIKLTALLQSKQEQMKSTLAMVEMYHKLGMQEKAKDKMEDLETLEKSIAFIESEMYNLKHSDPDTSEEVDNFLKRGRKAMGIESETAGAKKRKPAAAGQAAEDNDADEPKEDENDVLSDLYVETS